MKKRYENILETIGNTPLVRLNKMAEGLKPQIYVKVEILFIFMMATAMLGNWMFFLKR